MARKLVMRYITGLIKQKASSSESHNLVPLDRRKAVSKAGKTFHIMIILVKMDVEWIVQVVLKTTEPTNLCHIKSPVLRKVPLRNTAWWNQKFPVEGIKRLKAAAACFFVRYTSIVYA